MYEDTGERPACNHIARKAPLHSTSFMYSRGRLNERDWNPSSFEHLDVCSAGFRISMRSRRERPALIGPSVELLGLGVRIPLPAFQNSVHSILEFAHSRGYPDAAHRGSRCRSTAPVGDSSSGKLSVHRRF